MHRPRIVVSKREILEHLKTFLGTALQRYRSTRFSSAAQAARVHGFWGNYVVAGTALPLWEVLAFPIINASD